MTTTAHSLAALFTLSVLSASSWGQTVIQLRSGNGEPGQEDSLIRALDGPHDNPFPVLMQEHFDAADAAPAAYVVNPHGAWLSNLNTDPAARWIGTTGGSTALFSIPFEVPDATISRAELDFAFMMDNHLGDFVNNGLYINGQPVSLLDVCSGPCGGFTSDILWPALDVTGLVQPGSNTLYVNLYDFGVVAGAIFSATFTINGDPSTDSYCFGDPAAGLCPCDNHDGAGGCTNSTGSGALLEPQGTSGVFTDSLALHVSHMPSHSFGIVFMGFERQQTPFGDGLLCVSPGPTSEQPGASFTRFPIRSTGSQGELTEGPGLALWAFQNLTPETWIMPGQTRTFQCYYRNPAGPCGTTFNFSNALSVSFN